MGYTIHCFPLGPLEVNSYIIAHEDKAIIIDVGGDPQPILDWCKKEKKTIQAILLTHLHFDHIYGVSALMKSDSSRTIPVYAHEGDLWMMSCEFGLGGVWGLPEVTPFSYTPLPAGVYPDLLNCKVLHTPGHSPGGVSYYFANAHAVFTGDALFRRSIGRTDFPNGDHVLLQTSIKGQLFSLPPETKVYPGHGGASSIHEESLHNPHVAVN